MHQAGAGLKQETGSDTALKRRRDILAPHQLQNLKSGPYTRPGQHSSAGPEGVTVRFDFRI